MTTQGKGARLTTRRRTLASRDSLQPHPNRVDPGRFWVYFQGLPFGLPLPRSTTVHGTILPCVPKTPVSPEGCLSTMDPTA